MFITIVFLFEFAAENEGAGKTDSLETARCNAAFPVFQPAGIRLTAEAGPVQALNEYFLRVPFLKCSFSRAGQHDIIILVAGEAGNASLSFQSACKDQLA